MSPLMLPVELYPKPATRLSSLGVPGEAEDLIPIFDACLRVEKLDRANLVLKRLNTGGRLSPEQRIFLHNRYLRTALQILLASPDRQQAELLHKWYELQIRGPGLPHTAETIACMLKASLLSERGERLERLLRRYMGMAPGESGLQVLSRADILSDEDLAVITNICPGYNLVGEAEQEMVAEEAEEEELAHEPAPLSSIPELMPTPQRGLGLESLKSGLGFLSELQDANLSKLSEKERYRIQVKLEQDSITASIEKWRNERKAMQQMGISTVLSGKHQGSLAHDFGLWLEAMSTKIKEDLSLLEESETKATKAFQDLARCVYGPVLKSADPDRLAAITILSVVNGVAQDGNDRGLFVTRLVSNIGRIVQEDLQQQTKARQTETPKRRRVEIATETADVTTETSDELKADAPSIVSLTPETEESIKETMDELWSVQLRSQVGSSLLRMFLDSAKVNATINHPETHELVSQMQPAFTHSHRLRMGKKTGVISANMHVVEKLKSEPMGDFLAKHLPMIVEPKPWRRYDEGGFLASKVRLIRAKEGHHEQKLYATAATRRGDMKKVLKGLDVLGKTAWSVNQKTLQVMVEAWNTGEAIANLPALDPQFDIPEEPDASADPLIRQSWARKIKQIENARSGLHSERCHMNLQLEVARALRNQTIYFPHNIDYRGRAYPMPTYLNHMGADHTRALLKFAKGKELGQRGLRWLKIHLANVYGLDKASFDEREAFANENLDNIKDSAANPLKGNRWWLKAEDPFQCLSACFEIAEAYELPDPTKFVSSLPVHQDGTCNGLQHYAALGGDTWGARQVNLEPGDRPADVYTAVADLVKEAIARDIEAGNEIGKALDGKITRKVVKQTVMTNVYGVTFAGAKAQVLKQIDNLYPTLHKECGIPHVVLANYIAKHIFSSLATMFRGAHDIQSWLGQVGGRVCRALTPAQIDLIGQQHQADKEAGKKLTKNAARGVDELAKQFRSTIIWTTPLRMPVIQPYRKATMREVRTAMQTFTYPTGDQTDPVMKRKQLQGFPPNFIHSLDASHMLLSALQCNKRGLDFAAVHDSFWTHAADIDVMNVCLREAFIQIHEDDVVGRLGAEFELRHAGSIYMAHIASRSPLGLKIKELRANSKLSVKEELLLEHKRQSLKRSSNPWDVEAANKIVTPASIYEEFIANTPGGVPVEIEDDANAITHLGQIPDEETDPVVDSAEVIASQDVFDGVHESAAADEDVDGESAERGADMKLKRPFENMLKTDKKRAAAPTLKTAIWLPLTIPAVPKKGDFDVKRLRESKYFFS
jgi:DNA-directed RNA polymerase